MSRPTWRNRVGMLDHPGPAGSAKGSEGFQQAQKVRRRSLSNATTGSDRIVPGQQPPEERDALLARLIRPAVTHWQFGIVLAAAIVMRIIVILGYPPILWFNDSYNSLYDAVTHVPDLVRPNGYPFFLDLLLPLRSAYPLALLQAAMGRPGRHHLRAAAPPWPALVGSGAARTAGPVRLVRTSSRAHGHRRSAVRLPCDCRRGDALLERPPLGPDHGGGGAIHRVRDPGEVRRRAAAHCDPDRHAGQAGGLAPPRHPGRRGHRADRRVRDLVPQHVGLLRHDGVLGSVLVQPGQHVRGLLEDEPARRPALPVRPAPAAGPSASRTVHLGG